MTDIGYYGPPVPDNTVARPTGLRNRIMIGAAVLAALSVVGFFVSLMFFSTVPGTCDAWVGCRSSEREEWSWTAKPWATVGVMLGSILAWWAFAWGFLMDRPTLRKWLSVVALIVLIPATALSALVAYLALTAVCDPNAFLCFSGPGPAAFFASPGIIAGSLSAALIAGMVMKHPTRKARVSTVALLIVTSAIAASLGGTLAAIVLSPF